MFILCYIDIINTKLYMQPNFCKNIILLFLLFIVIPNFSIGQKWIADTLTISQNDSLFCSFNLEKANDNRNIEPNFISVYEQKKWLFFPVDQIVKTEIPLNQYFEQQFSCDSNVLKNYIVDINQFYINNSISSGKRFLTLYSTLELSKKLQNDTSYVGAFYYEKQFKHKKKEGVIIGYESLLSEWSNQFISDVLSIEHGLDLIQADNFYHFRRNKAAVKRNLYTEVETFVGFNFWGVDGEIWFSEPEGNRIFNRSAGIMRYVNHSSFQAIAMGKNLRLWNYRINDKWLFTHKIAFLMGFNNWKDMDTAAHKFEEIFLFDLSFTQRINYNPFDKSAFVFGVGLMEDVHYIIYHKPKLNIGLSVNCAYKF